MPASATILRQYGAAAGGWRCELAWDGLDRLRRVGGPGGREEYHYDHTGARASR